MRSIIRKGAIRDPKALSYWRPGITAIGGVLIVILLAALFPRAAFAQDDPKPRTRAEAIEMARREKIARLWPESKSPIAEIVNRFVERGFLDGVQSGMGGGNGAQLAIGGMRSGQGISVGFGYRRSD